MRRSHVCERAATRAVRVTRPEPSSNYAPPARAEIALLPGLLILADAAGAVTLARFLVQAPTRAERLVRRPL